MLEEIAKNVQKKYNSDVAKMIKDIEHPKLLLPVHPVPLTVINLDGTVTQEKIDKIDIYAWEKDYELIHNQKPEFVEKEKRVFPIILDQCSTSLKIPVGKSKNF